MIKGKRRVALTIDSILNRISEYDVFRYYMPNKDWKLNKATYSPFRNENNPSFVIGNKKGFISFIDFADVNYRGDCFTFVKMLFHLNSLDDVLTKIDKDFGLGISEGSELKDYQSVIKSYRQPTEVKRHSLIQVVTKKFTNRELEYWGSYHQSLDDLRENNVYSVKKVFLNRQAFPLNDNEMVFGYLYDGHWKIYRPLEDKKKKWIPNNVPITAMDGKENIIDCDTALISKSKKDWLVMKKVFPCSCAVQNEGIGCFSKENVDFLKSNSKRQILSFDSDVVGVRNSQQITQAFDFGYCNVPRRYLEEGIKDWADLAKAYGLRTIEEYLKTKELI